MFSRHNRMIGMLYMLADAVLALASLWAAHVIRSRLTALRPLYPAYYYMWIVPLAVGMWMVVGLAAGIYREIREDELGHAFLDPLKVGFISATLLFALISAFKLVYISRLLLGLFAIIDLLAMVSFRLLARHVGGALRRKFGDLRHFLLVGNTPETLEIARTLEGNWRSAVTICGFAVPDHVAEMRERLKLSGLRRSYPVYALSDIPELLRRHVIDEVIMAVSKDELEKLEGTFVVCEEEGVKTRVLLSFFPHVISKVYLERLRDMPLLTFSATPENEFLLLLKRVVDFVMALALLLVLSPLLLVLALVIKFTSQGPVLYRQTRCGVGGRRFTLYKFRSMRPDADLLREELAALNEMDGAWFKIRNDPRCTPAGRFMRRFSLDELPQLFNILSGDMSFVGPRPPLPEEVENYERWQRRRLRMPPGLTCLWALEGRSTLRFRRVMELDLEYIDHWSPALDWKILLKTIPVVLLGRGAS
jgi:exopolysaccharide biosynthesis polyprenyl glycosylphosphotransferase